MNQVLKDILFLDIETVSQTYDYDSLDERIKSQWSRKASFLKKEERQTDAELFLERAGIYAEFGKIIVIGLGFFHEQDNSPLNKPERLHHVRGVIYFCEMSRFFIDLEG